MKARRTASLVSRFAHLVLGVTLLPVPGAMAQVNLPVLGDSLSGTISTQQEYDFGRELLRSIRSQTPRLNDPLIEQYLSSLTYKLAATSELTDHRLDFILIDNTQLNAFAAPGGIVGVNAGLFLFSNNEGQFASVLAHELAHLSQRHYARNVEQARNNTFQNMAGLLASLVIMATAGGEAGQAALMTSQALSVDNKLRFSRSNEQEADRIGIRNLYNAGFDPDDMGGMFEQMLRTRNTSQRMPEFMSTHPLDENRIADSKNRASTYPDVKYVESSEYLLMRERVILHYSGNIGAELEAREKALPQLLGARRDAALYAISLAQLKTGQFIQATQTAEQLLQQEPSRITYLMLSAEIAVAEGNPDKAIRILSDTLQGNPQNHPLTMAYASALAKSGQHVKAATVLEQHANVYPDDMQLWNDLAEYQGIAGNISKVHLARAEYLICTGDFARARDQLNYALTLETDRLVIARLKQRQDYIRTIQDKFYR